KQRQSPIDGSEKVGFFVLYYSGYAITGLFQFRESLPHMANQRRNQLVNERLTLAKALIAEANCTAEDSANLISLSLVVRTRRICDGKSRHAQVIRYDTKGHISQ